MVVLTRIVPLIFKLNAALYVYVPSVAVVPSNVHVPVPVLELNVGVTRTPGDKFALVTSNAGVFGYHTPRISPPVAVHTVSVNTMSKPGPVLVKPHELNAQTITQPPMM